MITNHVIQWRNIVIVATNDLAILKPQLSEVCDYLVCDEAGQGRHIQIITIASRMLIKTLFLVGDQQQIQPYRMGELKYVPHYNDTSVARFVAHTAPWASVQLVRAYRFHPIICELVSKAGYDGILIPGTPDFLRTIITGSRTFPLMRQAYPVQLIHLPGQSEPFLAHSIRNIPQCDMAMALVNCLAQTTDQQATVTVCCYYAGDAMHLAENMQRRWGTLYPGGRPNDIVKIGGLEVRTVHSFVGQESDVVILVTGAPNGQCRDTDWLFTKEPGNVAISRGRHGLFVIGNVDYLADERAETLGRFVRLVAEKCPAISGQEYLNYVVNNGTRVQQWRNFATATQSAPLLWDSRHNDPRQLFARCDLNDRYNWLLAPEQNKTTRLEEWYNPSFKNCKVKLKMSKKWISSELGPTTEFLTSNPEKLF